MISLSMWICYLMNHHKSFHFCLVLLEWRWINWFQCILWTLIRNNFQTDLSKRTNSYMPRFLKKYSLILAEIWFCVLSICLAILYRHIVAIFFLRLLSIVGIEVGRFSTWFMNKKNFQYGTSKMFVFTIFGYNVVLQFVNRCAFLPINFLS